MKKYSPGLSDRLALDSSQQTPTDLANELLILLGRRSVRSFPIAETVPVPEPQSRAAEKIRKGETVAYAWYWTKDGKIVGLYIRKAPSNAALLRWKNLTGSFFWPNFLEGPKTYSELD